MLMLSCLAICLQNNTVICLPIMDQHLIIPIFFTVLEFRWKKTSLSRLSHAWSCIFFYLPRCRTISKKFGWDKDLMMIMGLHQERNQTHDHRKISHFIVEVTISPWTYLSNRKMWNCIFASIKEDLLFHKS